MYINYRGGMWEGGGVWDGVKGGKWDNCSSIINKIYLKKKKKENESPGELRQVTCFL